MPGNINTFITNVSNINQERLKTVYTPLHASRLEYIIKNSFPYLSTKIFLVGTQRNPLNQTVLLRSQMNFMFKLMAKNFHQIFTLLMLELESERNHLCNLSRRHQEEQFYEIILNLNQFVRRRYCLKIVLI